MTTDVSSITFSRPYDPVADPQILALMTTPTFIVQGTGSRDWTSRMAVWSALLTVRDTMANGARLVVRHGAAPGFDTVTQRVADDLGIPCNAYPADWPNCGPECPPRPHRRRGARGEYCPLAGPRRNRLMANEHPGPDVLLAGPLGKSNGTWGCVGEFEKRWPRLPMFLVHPVTGELVDLRQWRAVRDLRLRRAARG